jgi:hypothetical protein
MRSISRLFGAFGTLADSLLSLSAVVNTATDKLRLQLASESEPLALDHASEVIDNPSTDSGSTSTKRRKAS